MQPGVNILLLLNYQAKNLRKNAGWCNVLINRS
jgi:hypothetical protein